MSPRAQRLYETADSQIAELAAPLSAAATARLREPCPGREKLGDGTVAAVAEHTLRNYQRIADFVAGVRVSDQPHARHDGAHRASELDSDVVRPSLEAARKALAPIRQLSDEQLDSVPAEGEMRFADGRRTLEQVLASVLRHQRHQVDALVGALS